MDPEMFQDVAARLFPEMKKSRRSPAAKNDRAWKSKVTR
jgi:hypothetical protein